MTAIFTSSAASIITAEMGWSYRRQVGAIIRMADEMAANLTGAEIWHADGLRVQTDICRQMVRTIDPSDYAAEDTHLIEIDRAISTDWQALVDIATTRAAVIDAENAAR